MSVELSWVGTDQGVDEPTRRCVDDRDHRGCGVHEVPDRDNATLIERCPSGELSAWNELVTRYERLVDAIPLRAGLGVEDAAEISQAAFETVVQSLGRITVTGHAPDGTVVTDSDPIHYIVKNPYPNRDAG